MKGRVLKAAVLCAISFFSVQTALASANNDLILLNNLHQELSFKVYTKEGHSCSAEFGVLKPDSYNKVTQKELIKSCPYYLENCMAYVYLSNNCTGNVIAYLTFSGYTGIESFVLHDVGDEMPDIQGGNYFMIFRGFKRA